MIGLLCGSVTSGQRNPTSNEASGESEFLSALNASLESFVHKLSKMNKYNAFIYAMGEVFWPCYRLD